MKKSIKFFDRYRNKLHVSANQFPVIDRNAPEFSVQDIPGITHVDNIDIHDANYRETFENERGSSS